MNKHLKIQFKLKRFLLATGIFLVVGLFLWVLFAPISEDFDRSFFVQVCTNSKPLGKHQLLNKDSFQPVTQTNKHASGYAVISMTSSLMDNPISQQDVMLKFKKKGKRGMFPSIFVYYLQSFLEDYRVSLVHPTNDSELKGIIIHQLMQNIPIPILISTTNFMKKKKRIDLNYSLIVACDPDSVVLASSFGFYEQISFSELKKRLEHSNYRRIPVLLKIATRLELYHINNIFLIHKTSL